MLETLSHYGFFESKAALNGMYALLHSDYTYLHQLYKTFSHKKVKAWEYCLEVIQALDGTNIRLSGNSNQFSVSFLFYMNGIEYIGYITKSYNRYYRVS